MRILVVDSNPGRAPSLVDALRIAGHVVDHLDDAGDAVHTTADEHVFDLVVLSMALDRDSGVRIVQRLRRRNATVPILALDCDDSPEARIAVLDAGADDCAAIAAPIAEILARVRTWVRRSLGSGRNTVRHGALSFDAVDRTVYVHDSRIPLSRREMSVLEVLLQRAGRLVSKSQLADHLYELGEEIALNSIEVYVHRLRKKIGDTTVRIATVRGLGYCLEHEGH